MLSFHSEYEETPLLGDVAEEDEEEDDNTYEPVANFIGSGPIQIPHPRPPPLYPAPSPPISTPDQLSDHEYTPVQKELPIFRPSPKEKIFDVPHVRTSPQSITSPQSKPKRSSSVKIPEITPKAPANIFTSSDRFSSTPKRTSPPSLGRTQTITAAPKKPPALPPELNRGSPGEPPQIPLKKKNPSVQSSIHPPSPYSSSKSEISSEYSLLANLTSMPPTFADELPNHLKPMGVSPATTPGAHSPSSPSPSSSVSSIETAVAAADGQVNWDPSSIISGSKPSTHPSDQDQNTCSRSRLPKIILGPPPPENTSDDRGSDFNSTMRPKVKSFRYRRASEPSGNSVPVMSTLKPPEPTLNGVGSYFDHLARPPLSKQKLNLPKMPSGDFNQCLSSVNNPEPPTNNVSQYFDHLRPPISKPPAPDKKPAGNTLPHTSASKIPITIADENYFDHLARPISSKPKTPTNPGGAGVCNMVSLPTKLQSSSLETPLPPHHNEGVHEKKPQPTPRGFKRFQLTFVEGEPSKQAARDSTTIEVSLSTDIHNYLSVTQVKTAV